jgi:two-component system chemotaxis response regulator CheY
VVLKANFSIVYVFLHFGKRSVAVCIFSAHALPRERRLHWWGSNFTELASMGIASEFGRKLHILVADDHSLTRSLVRAILRGAGFEEIVHAETGVQAVQIITNQQIDLVICDWNMPEGTGLEVLRTLRADERFKKLPFIMLTAEAYRENVLTAAQSGSHDYVVKPFTADVLLEKVESVLRCHYSAHKSSPQQS